MREKEWSSTASDEEGDQVTYGNPEHYIGGLFDQSYTEDHNRSQDVDWMNAISSSYKPLAGLKKRKEEVKVHVEAEIDYSWSGLGWNDSQSDIFPSDKRILDQTPSKVRSHANASSASNANRLWKVTSPESDNLGSKSKTDSASKGYSQTAPATAPSSSVAPPSASKHSFHSKQLSPEEAVLDRPAHWASAKKVVKRPPLSSIQASQFNKKPRGKEHLVVAALPPPAPISSSTATSSASSSSRSIKPAWMQRRTAAPLAFAASSSRTARVTEDDIVEDAPDDSHYEPPPHTSSFSGSTSDIHRHQSSRTQAVHPVTQDYVMEKLHVTISPSGKGKSGRATAAKTGSLRWRLMKIHRESESVENWMSTIRLQSHVDHSGFDNPKNRAKHIVECEVIEILDIAQTTPFRVLKVMVLTPSPSANNHEVISPKNLLKDNELDPYEVVEPVSSASSAGAYLSLVLLREGLYPDLLHSLHTGKRIKLFDAQEIILPKDATQQLVVTDNLTRLLGEDLVAISGIASIFLSTYVWEYAS